MGMAEVFKIKQRSNGDWVPDHALTFVIALADSALTHDQKRQALFAEVSKYYPGQYQLEWDVVSLRRLVIDKINARTKELILKGFVHGGVRYSSSLEAQASYMLMRVNLVNVIVSNIDDTIETSLSPGALGLGNTLGPFLTAHSTHVTSLRASGNALKKQARNAATIAALLAITDSRT